MAVGAIHKQTEHLRSERVHAHAFEHFVLGRSPVYFRIYHQFENAWMGLFR